MVDDSSRSASDSVGLELGDHPGGATPRPLTLETTWLRGREAEARVVPRMTENEDDVLPDHAAGFESGPGERGADPPVLLPGLDCQGLSPTSTISARWIRSILDTRDNMIANT